MKWLFLFIISGCFGPSYNKCEKYVAGPVCYVNSSGVEREDDRCMVVLTSGLEVRTVRWKLDTKAQTACYEAEQ